MAGCQAGRLCSLSPVPPVHSANKFTIPGNRCHGVSPSPVTASPSPVLGSPSTVPGARLTVPVSGSPFPYQAHRPRPSMYARSSTVARRMRTDRMRGAAGRMQMKIYCILKCDAHITYIIIFRAQLRDFCNVIGQYGALRG